MKHFFQTVLTTVAVLAVLIVPALANPYPATLDNGNLVLVDGGMGVGKYADRSSVVAERYAPPDYQLAIHIVPVVFSEEYWREHGNYIGSPYKVEKPFLLRFRYYQKLAVKLSQGWDELYAKQDEMIRGASPHSHQYARRQYLGCRQG